MGLAVGLNRFQLAGSCANHPKGPQPAQAGRGRFVHLGMCVRPEVASGNADNDRRTQARCPFCRHRIRRQRAVPSLDFPRWRGRSASVHAAVIPESVHLQQSPGRPWRASLSGSASTPPPVGGVGSRLPQCGTARQGSRQVPLKRAPLDWQARVTRLSLQRAQPARRPRPALSGRGRFVFVGSRRPRLYGSRLRMDWPQSGHIPNAARSLGVGDSDLRTAQRYGRPSGRSFAPGRVRSGWGCGGGRSYRRPSQGRL